jgi:menaquinone-specific isochorismate synthase
MVLTGVRSLRTMENEPPPDAGRKLKLDECFELFLSSGAFLQKENGDIFWGAGAAESLAKAPGSATAFYNPDFYLENPTPWKVFPHNGVMKSAEFKKTVHDCLQKPPVLIEVQKTEPVKDQFLAAFQTIQEKIEKAEIKKAVPFVATQMRGPQWSEQWSQLFINLLHNSHEGFLYGLWSGDQGILGCSPESLFTFTANGNELRTMALAGTRATKDIQENSLLSDEKERREHDFVVQDIREKLQNYGVLRVGATYEYSVGLLTHLRTDIRLETTSYIPRSSFNEWVRTFHPTAALGVYPKSFDWRLMKNWDAIPRQSFGAPFGISTVDGYMHAIVAIRNIQWQGCELMVGSGCGVVSESKFENEWQELKLKRESVLRRFML